MKYENCTPQPAHVIIKLVADEIKSTGGIIITDAAILFARGSVLASNSEWIQEEDMVILPRNTGFKIDEGIYIVKDTDVYAIVG